MKPVLKLLPLTLLVASLQSLTAETSVAEPTTGLISKWRSVDHDTNYWEQIDVYEWGGEMKMKMWAISDPKERGARGYVADLPSGAANMSVGETIQASKDFGFRVSEYTLTLMEKGLKLETIDRYTDDSKRGTKEYTHYFVRGSHQARDESPKLVEKGWGGDWRNMDDTGGGWAQVTIRDVGEMSLSIWSFMGAKISQAPVSTMTFPLAAEKALSDTPPEEVIVSDDHGFAKYTYTMTLHNDQMTINTATDYKDPDRADIEFEDHFKRGEFPRE